MDFQCMYNSEIRVIASFVGDWLNGIEIPCEDGISRVVIQGWIYY